MSQTVSLNDQLSARDSSRGGAAREPNANPARESATKQADGLATKQARERATKQAREPAAKRARVRVRPIALPTEHGGWGLTLEPVALGLLVAPSVAGSLVALATVAAFLARQPLKIVSADRRRGRRFPRTPVAERFALAYSLVAATSFVAAVATAVDHRFLWLAACAAPLAAVQLYFDNAGRSRTLLPELAGSIAMASVAGVIALAGGARLSLALALWAVLAARLVPSIIFVRAALARLHGESPSTAPTYAAHLVALFGVVALVRFGTLPALALLAPVVLLARAARGLSAGGGTVTAKQVGFREIGYGALTVAVVASGYLLGR